MSPYDHSDQRRAWWGYMVTTLLAWGFVFMCFGVGAMAIMEAVTLWADPPAYCVPSNPRL